MFTAQTLYPWTGAGEGTNNKKIQDVSAGAGNTTSKCNFGTNTTQTYILVKPLTTNSTTGTPAGSQDFGWNVLKTDMNSSDGSAIRHIPSGNWTFNGVLTATVLDTTPAYAIRAYVHKRSSTGTLTELFNVESTTQTITSSINVSMTKTSAAEIFLNTDETIQIEYWVRGKGVALTGQTITFNIGTTTLFQEMTVVLPSPGIRTEFLRSVTASTTPTLTIIKKIGIIRTITMVGTATVTRLSTLFRTYTTTFVGTATMSRLLSLHRSFSATAVGTATMSRVASLHRSFSAVAIGTINIVKHVEKTITVTTVGVVTVIRRLTLFRVNTVSTTMIPTIHKVVSKSFSASMTGIMKAWAGLPFSALVPTSIRTTYSRSRVTNK